VGFLISVYSNFVLFLLPIDVLYLVSFLKYSMSKNVVTVKSGSEVIQGHWKCSTSTICGDACPLSCASAEAYKLAQCTRPQGWGS